MDPIAAYNHHSHWVWQTKFNPKHEQLLATSSSDSTVSLIHLGDLAKQKPISHHRSPSSMAKGQGNKTGPVESFSHDDSIYSKSIKLRDVPHLLLGHWHEAQYKVAKQEVLGHDSNNFEGRVPDLISEI